MSDLPGWLQPIAEGARAITADELTRFVPPPDTDTRRGAVLMLFGEGPAGPDLLLTERAHGMRSHPGQISFPGGSLDPTDASPELWLPPSNFAVTPVLAWGRDASPVGVVDPAEVESVHRVPVEELLDATHRVTVTHPSGYRSPGFLIGDDKDLILWGFTAGIITRLFDFVGWTRPWDASVIRELPDYMLASGGVDQGSRTRPRTDSEEA